MKYAKQAKKKFKKAWEKYQQFTPQISKASDTKEANKIIDDFVKGLGFDIYCQEFIIDFCTEVTTGIRDKKYPKEAMCLLAMIVNQYIMGHRGELDDEFGEMALLITQNASTHCFSEIIRGMIENGQNK